MHNVSLVLVQRSAPHLPLLTFKVGGKHVRLKEQVINLFLQKGSTKSTEDCVKAMERIRRILGGTEDKSPPPTLVVGDEETYSFLRDYRIRDPLRNSWIREHPGDWHIMLHGGKATSNRWWGAGIEVVAEVLGTDDKKSEDGAHYRRLHHHIVVTYEAIMNVCFDMCYADSTGNGERDRSDVNDRVLSWMEKRAEWHKTFRLWKVFLLTDFPAYIAFRTAVRMGKL